VQTCHLLTCHQLTGISHVYEASLGKKQCVVACVGAQHKTMGHPQLVELDAAQLIAVSGQLAEVQFTAINPPENAACLRLFICSCHLQEVPPLLIAWLHHHPDDTSVLF
jgi:hypothetical protein